MTITMNRKSGQGKTDGVVSELATYFTVKPGHEEELRASVERFVERIRNSDPKETIKTGLRDARFVIFNGGKQFMFASTFETDWDPYIDDALLVIGAEYFVDWFQHTYEGEKVVEWVNASGGVQAFDRSSPNVEQHVKNTSQGLKDVIQSAQAPAAAYFNSLAPMTMPEILQAQRVQQAFQQVLDSPDAEQALQHPALKPLLELAAD